MDFWWDAILVIMDKGGIHKNLSLIQSVPRGPNQDGGWQSGADEVGLQYRIRFTFRVT